MTRVARPHASSGMGCSRWWRAESRMDWCGRGRPTSGHRSGSSLIAFAAEKVASREWPPDHPHLQLVIDSAWDAVSSDPRTQGFRRPVNTREVARIDQGARASAPGVRVPVRPAGPRASPPLNSRASHCPSAPDRSRPAMRGRAHPNRDRRRASRCPRRRRRCAKAGEPTRTLSAPRRGCRAIAGRRPRPLRRDAAARRRGRWCASSGRRGRGHRRSTRVPLARPRCRAAGWLALGPVQQVQQPDPGPRRCRPARAHEERR